MMSAHVKNGKLKDKVAIITGAGSGLGRAITEAMAREGAKIVVAELHDQTGKEVANEISKAGSEAIYMKVDVRKSNEITEVVSSVLNRFGKIDILVNNAGTGVLENFIEGEERRWDRVIDIVLKGVILFSHAVLGGMVERRYGKIVNVSSNAGIMAVPGQVVYSAAKGGVIAFTRSLAAEVAPYHINVNAICPGYTITPGTKWMREREPDYFENIEKNIPWGRPGRPKDQANVALFLASDDAEYVTGQSILVDGGQIGFSLRSQSTGRE